VSGYLLNKFEKTFKPYASSPMGYKNLLRKSLNVKVCFSLEWNTEASIHRKGMMTYCACRCQVYAEWNSLFVCLLCVILVTA